MQIINVNLIFSIEKLCKTGFGVCSFSVCRQWFLSSGGGVNVQFNLLPRTILWATGYYCGRSFDQSAIFTFLLASFVAPFAAQNFASKYVKIVQIEPFLRSLSLVGVEDF